MTVVAHSLDLKLCSSHKCLAGGSVQDIVHEDNPAGSGAVVKSRQTLERWLARNASRKQLVLAYTSIVLKNTCLSTERGFRGAQSRVPAAPHTHENVHKAGLLKRWKLSQHNGIWLLKHAGCPAHIHWRLTQKQLHIHARCRTSIQRHIHVQIVESHAS